MINHATPHLFATEPEWHEWATNQPTSALEAERRLKWKLMNDTTELRHKIQCDFVIELIDTELTDRWEATN